MECKNDTNELNLQNRNKLTYIENKCIAIKGKGWDFGLGI